jgi:hypothetical protein
MQIFEFFLKYMGEMVGAGAGVAAEAGAAQKWTRSATLICRHVGYGIQQKAR